MFTTNSKKRSRTFDARDSVFQVFFSMQMNHLPGFIVGHEYLRHDFYAQREAADEDFAVGVAVHFAGCIGVLFEDFFFFVVQPGQKIVLMSDHQCQQFLAGAVLFDVYLAGVDVAVP